MNDHQDRRLMRLIHGELTPREARALEDEIARDESLAARHRRLSEAWNRLDAPAVEVPDDFVAGVVAAARGAAGELSWSLAPAWARAGSLAALTLGLVLGTTLGLGVGVDVGNGFAEPELSGDREAYLVLGEPSSLAESFWDTLEATEGRLDDSGGGGERVQ